jgi:hypothetical protein
LLNLDVNPHLILNPGDELSQAFASSDVFVMPSDTETLGFVVMEAMASGLPVVGVAAGGLLDIVQNGVTGYLAANPADDDDEGAAVVVDGERGRESGEVGDMGVAREAKEQEGEGLQAAIGAADQNGPGGNGGNSSSGSASNGSTGGGRSSGGDGMAEFAQYVSSLVGPAQSSSSNNSRNSNSSSSSSSNCSSSEVQRRIAMGSAARSWAEEWSWETATSKLRNVQYRAAIARFKERHTS